MTDATSWSVIFEPFWNWRWIGLAALLIAAIAALGLFARQRGAWFRAAAGLLAVAALANPVVLREDRMTTPSVVAIVIDRSQSARLGERAEQTDAALESVKQRFARLPQFELREVEARTEDGANPKTALMTALNEVLQDVPPARIGGAVLITDGQVHDVSDDFATNPIFNAPVHTLLTGEPDEIDRRISYVTAPRFGIVGKPLEFTYMVDEDGIADGEEAIVTIKLNGEDLFDDVAIAGEVRTITIELDSAGRNVIELEVSPLEDEMTQVNNRAIALVDGIRENLRVLLISGEPHAGERTWRNLLKSDASVDLVHFTILRPPEKQDGTPINELSLIAFPTRELFVDKIDDFDLIIFDRYQHRNVLPILYYDYIARYVEDGGALLVAAGPEFAGENSIASTPLFTALPALPTGSVVETGFYPRLTDDGNRHPVTRDLEGSTLEPPQWSRWFRQIDVTTPEGDVVMKGADEQPLLILNRVGEGRIAMLLSDQAWLWARGFEGGGPHVSLYRRMAHWLMQEPELEEERLIADGEGDTLQVTRQTMAEGEQSVTILTPSGESLDLGLTENEPGLYTASLQTDEIGLYQISDEELSTLAHVGPVNAAEWRAVVATSEIMTPVADATRGSVRWLSEGGRDPVPSINPVRANANASGTNWMGFRTSSETILRSVDRYSLLSGLLGLALLIGALGSTWWREGR